MIRPLKDRLILKWEPPAEKVGSFYVPQKAWDGKGFEYGTVLAVHEDETQVRVGDRVMFPAVAGCPATVDGEEVLGMRRSDLTAIIR